MLMLQKGINWNDSPAGFKRGRVIVKETYDKDGAQRTRWVAKDAPIFTQNERDFFEEQIPYMEVK